jgi:hypothetical protein
MSQNSHPGESPSRAAPRRRGGWLLWTLACFVVGGIVAMVGLNVVNSRYRLTSETLAAAQQRWAAAALHNYEITVQVSGGTSGTYWVRVEGSEITDATLNDQPFAPLERAAPWTVPGLFGILADDLANDAKPSSPVAYTRVEFDPQNGHLLRYLRTSGDQRLTMEVVLNSLE